MWKVHPHGRRWWVGSNGYNAKAMKPLSATNPYLINPALREAMVSHHIYESSVYEGARGLVKPVVVRNLKLRSKASTKKSVKSE